MSPSSSCLPPFFFQPCPQPFSLLVSSLSWVFHSVSLAQQHASAPVTSCRILVCWATVCCLGTSHPQKATLFSSATTTFWFYSNSTFSLLMISRTSDTSPLSFTHLSNMSKLLLTPHWFGYKLHHTETHQSNEDHLWYLFCFKFHLHRFCFSSLWTSCH